MTLNGVMAVILRYFSEFGYLPGVLHKSSCWLSHLLMSSCYDSYKTALYLLVHRFVDGCIMLSYGIDCASADHSKQ